MRSSKTRSRGKPNRNRNPGNNINRVFDSSGPEGKVRGTPQQIIDKYGQLARDASLSNDRVAAENFQQHAEHYTRLLVEAQRDSDARRAQADAQNRERQQRDRDDREARAEPQQQANDASEAPVTPAESAQPDATEVMGGEGSGLVETPESKPRKRPSRGRKPRAPKADNNGEAAAQDPAQEAAAREDTAPDAPAAPEAPEAAE